MFHQAVILTLCLAAPALAVDPARETAPSEHATEERIVAPEIGGRFIDFELPSADGERVRLSDHLDGNTIVVLEWFCPTCRFNKTMHGDWGAITAIQQSFKNKGVKWFAMNSSGPASGAHTPEINVQAATNWEIEYPILLDPDGTVGRSYAAKTTPQFFVIGKDGTFAYIGAFDDNRQMQEGRARVNYVRQALEQLLAGETVSKPKRRPYGCAVKYEE